MVLGILNQPHVHFWIISFFSLFSILFWTRRGKIKINKIWCISYFPFFSVAQWQASLGCYDTIVILNASVASRVNVITIFTINLASYCMLTRLVCLWIFFFHSLKPVSYACTGEGLKLGMREQQGKILFCERRGVGRWAPQQDRDKGAVPPYLSQVKGTGVSQQSMVMGQVQDQARKSRPWVRVEVLMECVTRHRQGCKHRQGQGDEPVPKSSS